MTIMTPSCNLAKVIEQHNYNIDDIDLGFNINKFSAHIKGIGNCGVVTSLNNDYVNTRLLGKVSSFPSKVFQDTSLALSRIPHGYYHLDIREYSSGDMDKHMRLSNVMCDEFDYLREGLCGKIYLSTSPRLFDCDGIKCISAIACEIEEDVTLLYIKLTQLKY